MDWRLTPTSHADELFWLWVCVWRSYRRSAFRAGVAAATDGSQLCRRIALNFTRFQLLAESLLEQRVRRRSVPHTTAPLGGGSSQRWVQPRRAMGSAPGRRSATPSPTPTPTTSFWPPRAPPQGSFGISQVGAARPLPTARRPCPFPSSSPHPSSLEDL